VLDNVPQTNHVERCGWKLHLFRPSNEHVSPRTPPRLLGRARLGLYAERREARPSGLREEVAARYADLEQPAAAAAVAPHPAQAYARLAPTLSAL
jgi:hypothetical protein